MPDNHPVHSDNNYLPGKWFAWFIIFVGVVLMFGGSYLVFKLFQFLSMYLPGW